MSQATVKNGKFKRAIIISALLHIILFASLIWSSFDKYINVSADKNSPIDTVMMVDRGVVMQNDNHHQKQKINAIIRDEEQRKKQIKAPQQKQSKEAITKAAIDVKSRADVQTKKAVVVEKKQATTDVQKDIQKKAKTKTAKKVIQEVEKKAVSERASIEKKATTSKSNDLFDYSSLDKNKTKTAKKNNILLKVSHDTKNDDISSTDISNYAVQIKSAIESQFYDAVSYTGKICTLRIQLAPNGMLLDIKSEGGDPVLCNAALAAARQSKIPKPPSQGVYAVFKNALLDFKP